MPEPSLIEYIDIRLLKHFLEDLFANAAFYVGGHGICLAVMFSGTAKEFARVTAHCLRPANVYMADSACGKSSDVPRLLDEGNFQLGFGSAVSGNDTGGIASVYDNIIDDLLRKCGE